MHKRNFERSEYSKLITIEEARIRYQMSRNSVTRIAEEHGALKRFSPRLIRIDADVLDNAIKTKY